MEQRGFILIADITGYTAYLNESELEHARGTLTDLLELLIEHTRSPLVISRLEGDAVISYGLEAGFVSAQTFLETIESTYLDFRKAIELMVMNNTCQCNACVNVSALDLKFFVHFGSFVLQKIGGHDELLGTDINLIHRLLKNSVTADTGIRAYLLCTDAAAAALDLGEQSDSMVRHTEAVPDFGETSMWVMDMQPAYEARSNEPIVFEKGEVIGTLEVEIGLPQHIVWDYLSQLEFRKVLVGADRQELTDRKGGRIARGTTFHCFHGDDAWEQVILEWKPFERMVIETALDLPGGKTSMLTDYELTPFDGGTRLTSSAAHMAGSGFRKKVWRSLIRLGGKRAQGNYERFRDRIEEDFAARGLGGVSPVPDVDSIAASAADVVGGWSAAATHGGDSKKA